MLSPVPLVTAWTDEPSKLNLDTAYDWVVPSSCWPNSNETFAPGRSNVPPKSNSNAPPLLVNVGPSIPICRLSPTWDNFKFLLVQAKAAGLYNPVDYKNKPGEYCGMPITDNPYYDK